MCRNVKMKPSGGLPAGPPAGAAGAVRRRAHDEALLSRRGGVGETMTSFVMWMVALSSIVAAVALFIMMANR